MKIYVRNYTENKNKIEFSLENKQNIMSNNLSICLNINTFSQCVLPAMVHGVRNTHANMIQKLQTAQRNTERLLLGITRINKESNNGDGYNLGIKLQKCKWAGQQNPDNGNLMIRNQQMLEPQKIAYAEIDEFGIEKTTWGAENDVL